MTLKSFKTVFASMFFALLFLFTSSISQAAEKTMVVLKQLNTVMENEMSYTIAGELTGGGTYDAGEKVTISFSQSETQKERFHFIAWEERDGKTKKTLSTEYSFQYTVPQNGIHYIYALVQPLDLNSNNSIFYDEDDEFFFDAEVSITVNTTNFGTFYNTCEYDEVPSEDYAVKNTGENRYLVWTSDDIKFYGDTTAWNIEFVKDSEQYIYPGNHNLHKLFTISPNLNASVGTHNLNVTFSDRDNRINKSFTNTFCFAISDKYIVDTEVYPEGAGTISGAGGYDLGDTATLTATPTSDTYAFNSWTLDGEVVSTSPTYSTIVDKDSGRLKAVFKKVKSTVTVIKNEDYGTVTGAGVYNVGDTVTIKAIPKSGYQFLAWYRNGAPDAVAKEYSFVIGESDVKFEAVFDKTPASGSYSAELSSLTFDPVTTGTYPNQKLTMTVTNTGDGSFTIDENSLTFTGDTDMFEITPNSMYFDLWGNQSIINKDTRKTGSVATIKPKMATTAGIYTLNAFFKDRDGFINDCSTSIVYVVTDDKIIKPAVNGKGTVTGSNVNNAYKVGGEVTLKATPEEGWEFVCWCYGNEYYAGTSSSEIYSTDSEWTFTVEQNRSYTNICALFKQVDYKVTVRTPDGHGTVTGAGIYKLGDKVTLKATPASGFVFESYNEYGTPLFASEEYSFYITRDVSLTAWFVLSSEAPKKITISFDHGDLDVEDENAMKSYQLIPGYKYNLPKNEYVNKNHDGVFNGWIVNGERYGTSKLLEFTEDTHVTASWNSSYLYFLPGEYGIGENPETLTCGRGLTKTMPYNPYTSSDPTKVFKGWQLVQINSETGEVSWKYGSPIEEGTEFIYPSSWGDEWYAIAIWEDEPHTITFDSMGGSPVSSVIVRASETVKKPENPTRERYAFDGWYKDEECTEQFTFYQSLKENITVYAKWRAYKEIPRIVVSVTIPTPGAEPAKANNYGDPEYTYYYSVYSTTWYDQSGREIEGTTFEDGKYYYAIIEMSPSTSYGRESYFADEIDFCTFNDNYDVLGDSYHSDNDYIVRTPLMKALGEGSQLTVTFDTRGGSSIPSQTVTYGNSATKPGNPSRSGYVFDGWYTDLDTYENEYDFSRQVKDDVRIYAKWIETNDTTIYEINLTSSTITTLPLESGTLPGLNIEIGDENVSLYPGNTVWMIKEADSNGWRATYDGVAIADGSTHYGISFVCYAKNGFSIFKNATVKLNGKSYGSSIWFGDDDYAHVTLDLGLAIQKEVVYQVKFNINGGSSFNGNPTQNVAEGNLVTKPTNPNPPYNTTKYFAGWYEDEELTKEFTFDTRIYKDTTLYAKWKDLNLLDEIRFTGNMTKAYVGTKPVFNLVTSSEHVEELKSLYWVEYKNNSWSTLYDNADIEEGKNYGLQCRITFEEGYGIASTSDANHHTNIIYNGVDVTNLKSKISVFTSQGTTIYEVSIDLGESANPPTSNYKVTFNSNGGSSVSSQTVKYGELVQVPETPTKGDYEFEGWYTNEYFTAYFDFNRSIIGADTTLYAKWKKHVHSFYYHSASYKWNDDNSKVTASILCDSCDYEEKETVNTISINAIAPTCEKDGLRKYVATHFESDNFTTQIKDVIIEKLGHNFGQPEYEWSADHSYVEASRTCSVCGKVETETAGTNYVVTLEPTCTEDGTAEYVTEAFENTEFTVQTYEVEIGAIGHKWSKVKYKWSANNTQCTAGRSCTNCGELETETVKSVSSVTVEPTETFEGVMTYVAKFKNSLFGTKTTQASIAKIGAEPTYMLGDLDGDKKITIIDVRKLLLAYSEEGERTPEELAIMDIDGDGKVTIMDVRKLLLMYSN
ncbi:MAG: InlB B-repeat-containing protein [Clostridia bacterium]|nr:InlB B-repeat-containing protein [Clostridia bacterium]